MRSVRCFIITLFAFAATLPWSSCASAQQVWTGLTKSFSKAPGADPTLPGNFDPITDNVAISRNTTGGIFNVYAEQFHSTNVSPADTLWATDINNPGQLISASNNENLTFDTWVTAYGGLTQAGQNVVPAGGPRDAVVYLVTDDIYLDLRFTAWGSGFGGGGSFSYLRAEAVPEPAAVSLLALGMPALMVRRRRSKNP